MVESVGVRNGLLAGLASGVLTGVVIYATLPPAEVVLEEVREVANLNISEGVVSTYLSIALQVSGVLTAFIITLMGALFGWLQEVLAVRLKLATPVAAVISGLILMAILTLPNVALGASELKVVTNLLTGVTYTAALAALTLVSSPNEFRVIEDNRK